MKNWNRKGFVIEGAMVMWAVIALVIGATTVIVGPKVIQAVKGSNQNIAKQTHDLKESYPVMYKAGLDKNGEAIFKPAGSYNKTEKFYNINRENPPETWLQKFFGLGLYAILICVIVGGIITALGAWPLIKAWRAKLKAKLDAAAQAVDNSAQVNAILTADAKLIVQSVDAGWGVIKQTIEVNKQLVAGASDVNQKALFQAKVDALEQAIKDMKNEMDRVQDTSTYNLVQELMKNDE